MLVDIQIDGNTAQVMLDTGAPDTLILSGRVAKKLGIDIKSLKDFGEVGTVMGPMEVRLLETGTFRRARQGWPWWWWIAASVVLVGVGVGLAIYVF